MTGETTKQVFITNWKGRAIVLPLLRFGQDVVPQGFLDRDITIVRAWMDYLLASELRRQGTPVVSPHLLIAGTVQEIYKPESTD